MHIHRRCSDGREPGIIPCVCVFLGQPERVPAGIDLRTTPKSFRVTELDITVRASLFSGRVSLLVGVSAFLAGSYLEDFGLVKDAHFYYVGATYTIH